LLEAKNHKTYLLVHVIALHKKHTLHLNKKVNIMDKALVLEREEGAPD
jgi:hypothetical protein